MATATPTTDAAQALGGLEQRATDDPRVTWRPSPQGFAARLIVFGLLAALLLAVPHLLPAKFVPVVIQAVTWSIIALSLNVLMGYAGQVSLGHAAFVGVGAFAGGIALTDMGLPYPVAMVGAFVVGGFLALILGVIALRVAGLNLAIVTISFGLLTQETLFNIRALTGGGAGKLAPRPSFAESDVLFVYFCLFVLVAVWAFDWRLTESKAGRAIQALRDDERVAASWGINVTAYKLLAFVIAGALAGLAGLLFAGKEQVASPGSFSFTASLTFLLMTVVGGLRSRPGVVIGGAFFAVLPTLLGVAHETWGIAHGETLEVCTTAPPRVIQFVIGLAVIGAAYEAVKHRSGGSGKQNATLVIGIGAAVAGLWLAFAAFLGQYCIFATIDAVFETLIGAALLLLTLIQFPGGIAEQFAPIFRWLSFQPFKADKAVTVGGGSAGGAGSSARP